MANKLYNESYIQDIANAIREKNKDTSNKTYLVSEMGDAVREINTQKPEETKVVPITSNGVVDINPTDGAVLSKVTVNVDVKEVDTVDGWHIAVKDNGEPPAAGTTNTITFVYTKGGNA
jgi:hypothetical protein